MVAQNPAGSLSPLSSPRQELMLAAVSAAKACIGVARLIAPHAATPAALQRRPFSDRSMRIVLPQIAAVRGTKVYIARRVPGNYV
jgi:hypothetical protein